MRILILTDHATHTASNSFYLIANSLYGHPEVSGVTIASRSMSKNDGFFKGQELRLSVGKMSGLISFDGFDHWICEHSVEVTSLSEYDYILLRLPRPIHPDFFSFLGQCFPDEFIINRPSGISLTGSKQFLLNFPEWTAPTRLLRGLEEIVKFKEEMPIVLKPLEEYGGRGLLRIDGDQVYTGNDSDISFSDFERSYRESPMTYIGMKYLRNVSKGDKRIVVAHGEVLACSLRLPATGSWLCNVAQGGSAVMSQPTKRELDMIQIVSEVVAEHGIFMYGLDTLENDDGLRVISEINTLSVGGIAPAAEMSGILVGDRYADLFVNFVKATK